MLSVIILFISISACLGAPTATQDQPLLDFSQSPSSPPLFAALAALPPLNSLDLHIPQTDNVNPDQATQISPANQQLGQINLADGLNSLTKTALGSLMPSKVTPQQPVDPLFGINTGTGAMFPNTFPNTYPNSNFPPMYYPGTGGMFPNTFPYTYPNGNLPPFQSPGTGVMFPNSYPNNGNVQPTPSPAPTSPVNNFNPLRFLFPNIGSMSRGPFGMLMPGLMMRMLEGLMELF